MLVVHRTLGTYRDHVTRYIALNSFCRDKFIQGGLPPERVVIKPNFVDFAAPPLRARGGFLFVGRLSAEKGIRVLMDAWRLADAGLNGAILRVAGTGAEAFRLDDVVRLHALGALDGAAVREQMACASVLVLPSICYDSFPRTLVEAFASGLPVIASRLGPLADLVQEGVTGLLFAPGDPTDLAIKLRWACAHPDELAEMGQRARAKYETEFCAERNYPQLMAIYADAIQATTTEQR